jgi:deoxyribonuclease-4
VPPIGAHVQIKGGLATGGLAYTDAVGARAVQVFVGNPRGWRLTRGDPRQDAGSPRLRRARGALFVHTPFLVNVGSPTEATVEQSVATIAHNLARGARLGCRGVVVHAGSAVGEDRYEDALRQLHERLLPVPGGRPDDGPRLLVEPTAGGGGRWPPRSRTSARTSPRSSTTRCSASASTPATPGRPATS